ncbi:MAG: outer membrane protein assembly factor BamA [Sulfurimonas sp.]|nr:outer membrane protein assembly factor BamA [Sulfurimonas sp.]
MRIFLATLLIFLTTNIFAQTIKSIKYDGVVHISESVALRMLDFRVGDDVDEHQINKAIKTYFKQGYFADIYAEIEDGVLTFYFVEKPLISVVELKGYKENDEDIKDIVIRIKKGSLYDEKKLQAAKKRLLEVMEQEGQIDSVVEVVTEHLNNGSVKVIFFANEGEEIIINKLDYSGINGLQKDDFDEVIVNKESEWMGWFFGRNNGKMKLKDLGYDHLRIRDLYMQHGYLDAEVNEPFVKTNFHNYTATMSYQIKEGNIYNVSAISISQTKDVAEVELIREVIQLNINESFNVKTFREDAQRIKVFISDYGYAFAQVIPDLKKNEQNNTVEVIYKIIPGEKVKIRDVLISGNIRTLDRIIRREIYLGPGEMYSLTDLKDSRNALGRLGFFDGQTIEEKRIDNKTMDLIVKVKEASTGNIQLGGGYGSYGGLLINVGVNDRNIWGSGIDVGLKAERSTKTKNYSFNILNKKLNDSDFSGNFSIFRSSYEYNYYTVNSDGLTIGTGHKFTRFVNGYLSYVYSKNNYDLDEDFSNDRFGFFFESYAKSSLKISLSFDNTDDYYLPREGFVINQNFEKSGLGAEANYFKSRTKFSKYIGLKDYIGFDAIFRYKARYNFVADNGYLPISERFYIGGISSVRGYESYSISPTIIDNDGIQRRIGGEQTFSSSLELSLPLVPKAKMRIVSYVDWGFIGDDDITEYSRGGYGVGLEWFSPVGPIQLMFSQPLNKKEGDKISTFEFTMGQRF